jgi:thiamine biosynthesis lipoprotein
LERFEFERPAMGVYFRVIVYAENGEQAKTAVDIAWDELERVEQCLSDYRSDSEVNQLCKSAPHAEPVTVSPLLVNSLLVAREMYDKTDGAFDVTVGPLSHLWRGAIKRNRYPDEEKIAEALEKVGMDKVKISEDGKVQLLKEGMQLDFGGIAKGAAADRMLNILLEAGIENALVDASGDVSVMGTPPGDVAWSVMVHGNGEGGVVKIGLKSGSVATSGDSEQSLVIDGKRYSHIVDPRTGMAVTHTSRATVIAPNGATADAMASACCVLLPGSALSLIHETPDVEVMIMERFDLPNGGYRYQSLISPGYEGFRRRD